MAHHADDQLETTVYRLAKGSSVSGLKSMRAVDHRVVRPLLSFSKEEIVAYARKNKLSWSEDASNATDDYARNFIRHHIIPPLKEVNPSILKTNMRTTQRLQYLEEAWKEFSASKRRTYLAERSTEWSIDKAVLRFPYGALLLEDWLSPLGFSFEQVNSIKPETASGRFHSANNATVYIERHAIRVIWEAENLEAKELDIEDTQQWGGYLLQSQVFEDSNPIFPNPKEGFYMDYDQLKSPLMVRAWKEGDRFVPYGMKGSKKLSDFFIDEKVDFSAKSNIAILCDQEKIIGILGYRLDDRVKVTPATNNIFEIRWHSM
jgi:tRNA(Ile)-lysidine synthase